MRFVKNAYHLFLVNAPDDFNLALKLAFGVTAVEFRLYAHLIEQALVEPAGSEL